MNKNREQDHNVRIDSGAHAKRWGVVSIPNTGPHGVLAVFVFFFLVVPVERHPDKVDAGSFNCLLASKSAEMCGGPFVQRGTKCATELNSIARCTPSALLSVSTQARASVLSAAKAKQQRTTNTHEMLNWMQLCCLFFGVDTTPLILSEISWRHNIGLYVILAARICIDIWMRFVYFYKERDAERGDCIDLSVDKCSYKDKETGRRAIWWNMLHWTLHIGVDCR